MSKGPNTRLADLFGMTGWSKGELARLVNRQAAATGHPQLSTDTSRVRRWIETGEIPREPVPKVLAVLFTERLGRVVTTEDLGFERAAGPGRVRRQSDDALPWAPERTAEVLTEFTGMDLMLNRRGLVGAGTALAAGSALTSSLHEWLHSDPAAPGAAAGSAPLHAEPARYGRYEATPVGAQEVEALERSVEVFRAWDAERGGGLQRKAVVGQLNEVGGMLAYRHPEPLQSRLWGVAANLAVLAGWMSHDVGLEPTAQRYFVIAAHAAREGGDRPRAAEALSRAARQMIHLGRPDDALELVGLAKSGTGPATHARARSMLATIEAWAQAAKGRTGAVQRTLGEAEELFARDGADLAAPTWMQLFDEADLHGMQALAYRTLAEHDPAAASRAREHGELALAKRPEGRQRSQILDYVSLAAVGFLAGDPDRGERYTRLALERIGENSSHRTWDRLRQTHRLTAPYADDPAVKALREEAADTLARAPKGRTSAI
ncbi:DNA-binding protein NsdB [Streptomyces aculeolatus]